MRAHLTLMSVFIVALLQLCGCPGPEDVLDSIEFAWCPPGSFVMGRVPGEVDSNPWEGPQHTVTFAQGFWISKYEITQRQWQAIMGNNPSYANSWRTGNRPVEQVSWDDAQEFVAEANALRPSNNYALPSEAQWEYACRAGTATRFYWGDDPGAALMPGYAWVPANSGEDSHDVGQKLPNAWGIHDMAGNVWEWVADYTHNDYTGAPTDGAAWLADPVNGNRGVRGGSFYNAGGCRSAYRGFIEPESRFADFGIRIVMQPDAR